MLNKRLHKEIKFLLTQEGCKSSISENDYIISVDENNINTIYALIKPPKDSVYKHKFIIIKIDVPDNYPFSPPVVYFLNYDNTRIHPNLYEDGKCCSTILNTWPSENEKWTSCMNIEMIILMIQSFLDNNPYTHEPGGRDDESYTKYVLYQTYYTCLFRYVFNNSLPEKFRLYMQEYLYKNRKEILDEVEILDILYPADDYYTHCFDIEYYYLDYNIVKQYLVEYIQRCCSEVNISNECKNGSKRHFDSVDYDCNICFDSNIVFSITDFTTLSCKHSFHTECIYYHIINNGKYCSLCRKNIIQTDLKIKSPKSNRKIKMGGPAYKKLLNSCASKPSYASS